MILWFVEIHSTSLPYVCIWSSVFQMWFKTNNFWCFRNIIAEGGSVNSIPHARTSISDKFSKKIWTEKSQTVTKLEIKFFNHCQSQHQEILKSLGGVWVCLKSTLMKMQTEIIYAYFNENKAVILQVFELSVGNYI